MESHVKPDTDERKITSPVLQGQSKHFPCETIHKYFHDGFKAGRIRPENFALVYGEKHQTFQQLNDISTKIAEAIWECTRETLPCTNKGESSSSLPKNLNPDGDIVIGVCIQPSDKLVAILLGILKAGAAYMPFDIAFPEERIIKITKDCRPLLVICDGKSNVLGKFANVRQLTKVVSTQELYSKIQPKSVLHSLFTSRFRKDGNKKDGQLEEETAIVLYTSGSSGEPKGVRLSHRAVMNRLNWQWEQFPFSYGEKCVLKTSLTFVDSVAEIFGPLLRGVPVVIFDKIITTQPPLFIEKLRVYKITRLVLVPSLLQAMLQTFEIIGKQEGRKRLSSLKKWICSGETLSFELLIEFFENLPEGFTLCNFYGSTEIMGDVTFISFSSREDAQKYTVDRKTPIGFPIFNTSIMLLNDQLQPVEDGGTGEIFISGSNLATGYVGLPNSDKLLSISNQSEPDKMYRTGDFGRIVKLVNGESVLMYEGRIDSQVKVRGHRIDLSDVESVISRFESVSKVKVLCYHPAQHDQMIVAYVVPHQASLYIADHIRFKMNKSLREYERPTLRILAEIPLLVNGKTDRQRLLNLFESEMKNREEFDDWESLNLPKDKLAIGKNLLKIVSQVTGTSLQTIAENIDDSFFNIGGSSLNTVEVIVKLRDKQLYISIPDFTSASNLREVLMSISTEEKHSPCESCPLVIKRITEKEMQRNEYSISALTDEDKDQVVHIISYSFSKKGDLEAYVNVTYEDYEALIRSMWKDIVAKGLSFIVRRSSNGKAVAVSLNFDVYDEPSEVETSEGIKYVMEFLEFIESQQRNLLPKGKGKLLHSFMMGTPEDIEDSERVALIGLMEDENILIAKQKQFLAIFTTNTNELTMQIGRDLQGYEILCDYQVNEYVTPDGVKPFGLAPDSFRIICCWKQL